MLLGFCSFVPLPFRCQIPRLHSRRLANLATFQTQTDMRSVAVSETNIETCIFHHPKGHYTLDIIYRKKGAILLKYFLLAGGDVAG